MIDSTALQQVDFLGNPINKISPNFFKNTETDWNHFNIDCNEKRDLQTCFDEFQRDAGLLFKYGR